MSLGFVLLLSVSFLCAGHAKAATTATSISYTGSSNDDFIGVWVGQNFQAPQNNINRWDFLREPAAEDNVSGSWHFQICQVADSSGGACISNTIYSFDSTVSGGSVGASVPIEIDFPAVYPTITGQWYKIQTATSNYNGYTKLWGHNGSVIDNAYCFNHSTSDQSGGYTNEDLNGTLYYDDTYNSCGDGICETATENCSNCANDCGACVNNPNADSFLFFFNNPYTRSNLTTAKIQYIYDASVITPYDYIEIRQDDGFLSTTSSFIATSSIIDTSGFFSDMTNGNSYFSLVAPTSTPATGYMYYSIIGHLAAYWSPTMGDVAATTTFPYSVVVNWTNPEIVQHVSACFGPAFDLSHLCDGIATGTVGNLECGASTAFAYAGHFLFYPSCDSLNVFNDFYGTFKKAFPYNAYYQIIDSVNQAIATTSVKTSGVISIPFIHATNSNFYMLPIVNSSSLPNLIGATNTAMFRTGVTWLMWIFAAGICFLLIWFL